MRAAVLERPGTLAVVDVGVPVVGPGQVLVRLSGSGVCGSNLAVWEGRPWFTYPLPPGAPGHEGWGRVELAGAGVDLAPGTPVAMLSQHAFAEFDVANASEVVALPPAVADKTFPGEAIACAVNVMRRSGITPGQRVAVVGIGFLGAVLVRLASRTDAEVTAITRRPFALEVATALGATRRLALSDSPGTMGEFDVVIEATGLQSGLDVASQITATRGRLVIAGYHQDGKREVDMQSWNWRGIDVVNAHERDPQVYIDGMREAARLVEENALPLDLLVTHVFPLSEAGDAFRMSVERPDGFLKAVVRADA